MNERRTWYFTFGFGQVHPRTGESLKLCYTTATGTKDEARERVIEIFGRNWSFQYANADGPDGAGLGEYSLTYVPCVEYSPGELLPPTPLELKRGEWALETYRYTDTYQGREIYPYYPDITELTYMLKKYGIPDSACVEYGECGSHTITIRWDVNDRVSR